MTLSYFFKQPSLAPLMMPLVFVPIVPLPNALRLRHLQPVAAPAKRLVRKRTAHAVLKVVSNQQHEVFDAVGETVCTPPDGFSFQNRAIQLTKDGALPKQVSGILLAWFDSYRKAVERNDYFIGDATQFTERNFSTLLELCRRAVKNPTQFGPYHVRVRQPFDYYKFGFDFASILLDADNSSVLGRDNLNAAIDYARQGHNIIFVSNHQSEGDPVAIDLLLSFLTQTDRQFCEDMVFMAGDRVRNDPVISPFSLGRNLLTVYSKKHINDVPELREAKLSHNRCTIAVTTTLFKEGGKVIWFAPSGGRDRRNEETGLVELSAFDDGAVEMMRFAALKSGVPSHFYPMSLWTYDMLPPPSSIGGAQFGEERIVNYVPMHMWIGEELDWVIPSDITEKVAKRKASCELVFDQVKRGYRTIGGYGR